MLGQMGRGDGKAIKKVKVLVGLMNPTSRATSDCPVFTLMYLVAISKARNSARRTKICL